MVKECFDDKKYIHYLDTSNKNLPRSKLMTSTGLLLSTESTIVFARSLYKLFLLVVNPREADEINTIPPSRDEFVCKVMH